MQNGEAEHVNVLLHNDETTHMEFVVFILKSVFDKSEVDATEIMLRVHHDGAGIAGSYERETARAKVSAVQLMTKAVGYPLQCTVEGRSESRNAKDGSRTGPARDLHRQSLGHDGLAPAPFRGPANDGRHR